MEKYIDFLSEIIVICLGSTLVWFSIPSGIGVELWRIIFFAIGLRYILPTPEKK
jgi:hypothetical protein